MFQARLLAGAKALRQELPGVCEVQIGSWCGSSQQGGQNMEQVEPGQARPGQAKHTALH